MSFSKHYRPLFLVGLFILSGAFSLQAQSKKKLREEIKELKAANTQLRNENRKLKYEKDQLEEEKKQIVDLTTFFEEEVYRLRKDSAQYHTAFEEVKLKKAEFEEQNKANVYKPDPNDNRPCARQQSSLAPGSYFRETLNPLASSGWGVQVFSFSSLCQAQEKAEEFSAKYHMWKTYIMVKEVNGQKVFSVVYGTLRDEQQARTYCENFKKVASGPEAANAFLVQH